MWGQGHPSELTGMVCLSLGGWSGFNTGRLQGREGQGSGPQNLQAPAHICPLRWTTPDLERPRKHGRPPAPPEQTKARAQDSAQG